MKLLNIKNVSLTYFSKTSETLAITDISFDVKDGEFVSIIGPSGCGKTTILSLIAGLIKPTKGTIELYNPNSLPSFIGYMFQKDELFEWRTVQNNVYLGLEIQHQKTKENTQYVDLLLQKYGLWEFKDKYPNELSGGMRQRVALIRTLALKPKILLLDEAFSALDYQTRISVSDDIARILKEEKITSVLVTHDINEAISLSDRIVVLTKRPAKVENIHNMSELSKYSTPLQKRQSIEAQKYFDIIWKELSYEKKS